MNGGLVLRLRPNEKFLVNGVVLENGDRRTTLCVKTPDAKILRLRDAMHPSDASTPTKRLYYIAQLVVAGEADADEAQAQIIEGLDGLQEALKNTKCHDDVLSARRHVEDKKFYHVMRALGRIVPHEATLLTVAGLQEPDARPQKSA